MQGDEAMKSEMRARKWNQSPGDVNRLIAPEMRQRIRELKRGLVQCGHPLLDQLGSLDTIVEALGTAVRAAECLLTDDPFVAWDKVIEEDEWDELSDATEKQQTMTTAAPNVKKMITRPMQQQLIEAIKRLDEYHGCLTELVNDLSKLESFETAWGFAKDLQSDRPLETAEARKKRKEAETEAEAEAEDDLDGL
jgi:predicted DNA binding CopG/RHH family protein